MVEILVSSWEGLFSGAMLVSGRVVVKHTTKKSTFCRITSRSCHLQSCWRQLFSILLTTFLVENRRGTSRDAMEKLTPNAIFRPTNDDKTKTPPTPGRNDLMIHRF